MCVTEASGTLFRCVSTCEPDKYLFSVTVTGNSEPQYECVADLNFAPKARIIGHYESKVFLWSAEGSALAVVNSDKPQRFILKLQGKLKGVGAIGSNAQQQGSDSS